MKNFIFLLSATTLLASCSFEQKPAPYEANNSSYFGRGNSRNNSYASNDYIGASKKRSESRFSVENTHGSSPIPVTDDYNSRIDAENASSVSSRPLGAAKPIATTTEVYNHQQSLDNSGIIKKPLSPIAIDSNEQIVKIGEKQPLQIQPKITTAYDLQRNNVQEDVVVEETIPPVGGNKPGYLNLSQVSESRKADDKLSRIKPINKPEFTEEVETVAAPEVKTPEVEPAQELPVAETPAAPEIVETAPVIETPLAPIAKAEKPKIVPVIQRVETNTEPAAGAISKSTSALANKQAEADEEEETIAVPANKSAVEAKPLAAKEEQKQDTKPKASQQFIKPVDGVVISEFGSDKTGGGFNDGINIQAPEGTPVKAANGGTVVYSGNQLQGYGNLIIIRHPNGYLSAYSHLKELEIKKGDTVSQGDVLGHVGKTGNVETPQLHFGIRKGREPVDPKNYI